MFIPIIVNFTKNSLCFMCDFSKRILCALPNLAKQSPECSAPRHRSRAFEHVKQPAYRHDIGENSRAETQYGIQPYIVAEKFRQPAYGKSRENKKRDIADKDRDFEFQNQADNANSLVYQPENKPRGESYHKAIGN